MRERRLDDAVARHNCGCRSTPLHGTPLASLVDDDSRDVLKRNLTAIVVVLLLLFLTVTTTNPVFVIAAAVVVVADLVLGVFFGNINVMMMITARDLVRSRYLTAAGTRRIESCCRRRCATVSRGTTPTPSRRSMCGARCRPRPTLSRSA